MRHLSVDNFNSKIFSIETINEEIIDFNEKWLQINYHMFNDLQASQYSSFLVPLGAKILNRHSRKEIKPIICVFRKKTTFFVHNEIFHNRAPLLVLREFSNN